MDTNVPAQGTYAHSVCSRARRRDQMSIDQEFHASSALLAFSDAGRAAGGVAGERLEDSELRGMRTAGWRSSRRRPVRSHTLRIAWRYAAPPRRASTRLSCLYSGAAAHPRLDPRNAQGVWSRHAQCCSTTQGGDHEAFEVGGTAAACRDKESLGAVPAPHRRAEAADQPPLATGIGSAGARAQARIGGIHSHGCGAGPIRAKRSPLTPRPSRPLR
jgi:hypothetical protein